jgi:hypothetical protein
MGLSLDTYLDLTPFQFSEAYKRFLERVGKEREWQELKDWQIARWQVWRTLCPPNDKKEYSVMDILELPGDREAKDQAKAQENAEHGESSRERFEALKYRFSS